MSVSGGSNVEYVSARVRARRAALYDEEDYRKLVRMGTGEIARFMEESAYEREVNALGARHAGVDLIEYSLNANLARNFEDLLRWCEGPLYGKVARYLRKFDAWNVKTLLRGVYADADAQTIKDDLILGGELEERFLEGLAEAATVEEVVEGLDGTTFGEPLADALPDYEESSLLVPLENAVDRAYYERLMGEVAEDDRATELYVEFLQAEIDFRNVRNALRIARSGADIDVSEYFIEGGRLFDPGQLRALGGSMDDLLARLRESQYGDDLGAALDQLAEGESLIAFEHALDAALLSYSDHLSHVYPLSVCPVLAYVLAKEQEVSNIRAIARGREAGLSPEEIETDLVVT